MATGSPTCLGFHPPQSISIESCVSSSENVVPFPPCVLLSSMFRYMQVVYVITGEVKVNGLEGLS